LAQGALRETAEGPDQGLAAHGAQDHKHLARVAAIAQHPEGAHRLKWTEAG
jgi:hypothetical protein